MASSSSTSTKHTGNNDNLGEIERDKDIDLYSLHRTIENGRQKYLCFTKLKIKTTDENASSDGRVLMLEVSDGLDLWIVELDDQDVDTHRDLHNMSTSEAFYSKIR